MRKTGFGCIVIIALLFVSIFSNAQNYRLIDPDRIRTYGIDSTQYFFTEVDSITTEVADSIFYFNYVIDTNSSGGCFDLLGGNTPIGSKMLKLNDDEETYVFFNKNGDSIYIKLHQPVGSFWRLYNYPDGKHIRATVTAPLYITVLPETFDSIYRLILTVYDDAFVIHPDSIMMDTKMEIAKNHGLVEFKDFYNFPNDTSTIFLKGITNPENSIVDLNAYGTFNFQPGNEFHYLTEQIITAGSETIGTITKEKFFVLSKEQFTDSVRYTMYHALWQELFFGFSAPDTMRVIDTVTITYRYADYAYLDSIELTLLQANNYGFSDFFKYDSIYWGRAFKEVYDWFEYDAATQCLNNPDNIFLPEQRYGDGIGIMHYIDSVGPEEYIIKDQVYFQKGLEVWGEPFDFEELGVVDVQDFTLHKSIKIHPNPASDVIYFSLPEKNELVSLVVMDMQGRVVIRSENIMATEMQLQVSDLVSGMYILRLVGENNMYTGKFVKN